MAASLRAAELSVALGAREILNGVSVLLSPGQRLGVVGANGVGKSTLLRALAGLVVPERGSVERVPPDATVGYLPQEPDRRPGESVLSFLERRTGVAAANAELDAAADALGAGERGAEGRYSTALDRWTALGCADFEARVPGVLADLGIDAELARAPMPALSGGQAARVSLASILLSRFDVLLLDEPTNDLDFEGLERLEAFVRGTGAALAIVSHDRAFLERSITDVLEIDAVSGGARLFGGGWLAYLEDRAVARRHAEEAYEVYATKRDGLKDRAQRQRLWSNKGVAKAKRDPNEKDKIVRAARIEASEKLASKARATERALERLEVVDKPWVGWELRYEIRAAARSGDVVARLAGARVTRGDFSLGPVDLELRWAERVAIVGPNGSGKTTLLDAILGRVELTEGSRFLGPGVVVGELGQRRARFLGEGALAAAFAEAAELTPGEARTLLAKFGLGAEHVSRPVESLSPGERTRAEMALFQARGVNCLVLDEPTNHLDLPAIEQLEGALAAFPGTVLLVTHDRRMLDGFSATRTLTVAEGQVSATG